MLNRFFTPKWQHKDAIIRERALISLDNEADATIIKELATDDPSSKIRNLALRKIDNTTTLKGMLESSQNPSDWFRYATRINKVSPSTSELLTHFKQIQENWKNEELLDAYANCEDKELTEKLLLSIEDNEFLFLIANKAKSIATRLLAVEKIADEDKLRQLSKIATNKEVLKSVKQKLSQQKEIVFHRRQL